jgi:hypothetical protein
MLTENGNSMFQNPIDIGYKCGQIALFRSQSGLPPRAAE